MRTTDYPVMAHGPRRRQQGAAAVELALLTIPLVLMAIAAIEYSRVMYQYDVIAKATRDAVRVLTAFEPGTADYPTTLAIQRVVKAKDAGGNLIDRLQGLANANVQICDRVNSTACPGMQFANVATGSGAIDLVRVQVSGYQFQPLFGGGILPTLTFGPVGTTMMAIK